MSENKEQDAKLGLRVKVEGSLLDINLRISGKWVLIFVAAASAFLIPGSKEFFQALLSLIR
jgi:hypothetical protein